ncbi:MAG: hypothetical protein A3G18_04135 [Rhodospirillales bacterium RIFCSPLOWO2_12_FULL_58_28]|nr:MAG: hypothetical protein A3H92_05015 [Rhodospirillales bacterium RIFCSPLOWO2_02_FULL_58_16]OHC78710.1 MAG: hypothetical protein A3G18_04135 [Rhodospirillales bacterium RIFCSPLOWO2_12_FULL_58_28]
MQILFSIIRKAVILAVTLALPCSASAADAAADKAGFTGMQVQGITKEIAVTLGLGEEKGVLVRDIDLGGPADKADLKRGDLIVKFAGQEIDTFKRLISAVEAVTPDQTVPVTVLRNGKTVELKLNAVKRPEARSIAAGSFAAIPELGLTMAALTEKMRTGFDLRWSSTGVVITLLDETKKIDSDLKRGEIIVQVNQQDVWDPRQVVEKYQEAKGKGIKSLLLLVEGSVGQRNGFRFSMMPVK